MTPFEAFLFERRIELTSYEMALANTLIEAVEADEWLARTTRARRIGTTTAMNLVEEYLKNEKK